LRAPRSLDVVVGVRVLRGDVKDRDEPRILQSPNSAVKCWGLPSPTLLPHVSRRHPSLLTPPTSEERRDYLPMGGVFPCPVFMRKWFDWCGG